MQRLQSVGAHVGQRPVLNTGDSPDVGVPLLLRRTAQDNGYGVIQPNVCVNNKVQGPLELRYGHVSPAVNSVCKYMTFIVQHVLFHISDHIISKSVWKCLGNGENYRPFHVSGG